MPVMEKLLEMFPDLGFVCTWQNEGENERHSIERDPMEDAAA